MNMNIYIESILLALGALASVTMILLWGIMLKELFEDLYKGRII